jgi:NAD(P)H-quinone oxidoreductase subunit 5
VLLIAACCRSLVVRGVARACCPGCRNSATLAALALAVAGVFQLVVHGGGQVSLLDGPLAIVIRLDAIAATMTLLVAFIGWIVMRYARTYLDGEEREGVFPRSHARDIGRRSRAGAGGQPGRFLSSPSSLSVSGFASCCCSIPSARPPGRRREVRARLARGRRVAVLAAGCCCGLRHGRSRVRSQTRPHRGCRCRASGVALLVLAAALKTAAFPLHGWLTEVMEAPTPVSALLHAGIINAGGFLLIRTADLVQASPGAMAALVMIGGLTALFGAVVMLTQSAVKTALAWSTISQMGFMLLQCGLGLWALALLHIVAHSMYKAHAFLSSGGAVAAVANLRRPGPIAVPSSVRS